MGDVPIESDIVAPPPPHHGPLNITIHKLPGATGPMPEPPPPDPNLPPLSNPTWTNAPGAGLTGEAADGRPGDGSPGDEVGIDAALRARWDEQRAIAAQLWLRQVTPPEQTPPQQTPPQQPPATPPPSPDSLMRKPPDSPPSSESSASPPSQQPDAVSTWLANDAAKTGARTGPPLDVLQAMQERWPAMTPDERAQVLMAGIPQVSGTIVRDVARGATEAPRQIVGGALDAARSAEHLVDYLASRPAKWMLEGLEAAGVKVPPEVMAEPDKGGHYPEPPHLKDATTVTGGLIRGTSQFLAGFAATRGVIGEAGGAGAIPDAVRSVVAGSLAQGIGFEGHEARLSDLIQKNPNLRNPVTEFLASDPNDSEAMGRFKNALEGLGLGALTEGMVRALRYMRDMRRARAAADAHGGAGGANPDSRGAGPLVLLGDDHVPLVLHQTEIDARQAAARAAAIERGIAQQEKLPPDLAGLQPTYQAGRKMLAPTFESDIDRALFIVSQTRKDPHYGELIAWLKGLGYTATQIRDLGREVRSKFRDAIARQAADQPLPRVAPPRFLSEAELDKMARAQMSADDAIGLANQRTDTEALGRTAQRTLLYGQQGLLDEISVDGGPKVFINFGRIDTSDDIHRLLDELATTFAGHIDAARRGVRGHAETVQAAGAEDAWALLMSRRQGQPFNAEQSFAARTLWTAAAAKLMTVAAAADAARTPENLYQFRRMLAIYQAIQSEVIAARTETARALDAWKIPVDVGGRTQMRAIENLLSTYGGEEGAALLAHRISLLKNLPDGMSILGDLAERSVLQRSLDVIKEVWVNALLGNPKTHVVNIMGNTAGQLQDMIERLAAAGLSQQMGSGEIGFREAAERLMALRQGMREGLRLFNLALRTGDSQFGIDTTKTADFPRAISSDALGLPHDAWYGRAVDTMGTIVNMPVRFLTAEDDFFKAVAYRSELAARAFRQASKEATDGTLVIPNGMTRDQAMNARIAALMASPPEDLHLAAMGYASYLTYTDQAGHIARGLNAIERRLGNGAAGAQLMGLGMRMLIPFRNTPSNLVRWTFERTPLAPLTLRYRDAIARGGADADIARARMALGTFTMLAMMDFAFDGNVTAAGPPKSGHTEGEREALIRSGWRPWAIKIGDRYWDYRRTDPIGMQAGIAAGLAEIIAAGHLDEDRRESVMGAFAAAALTFGNQVIDKSYMSGLSDFDDALHDPGKGERLIDRNLGAFIPSGLTEARRQIDPYMRYTASLVDELRNRTPGLSDSLPPRRDMWGRVVTYRSGLGAAYDLTSPVATSRFNPEPVDTEALGAKFNLTMPSVTQSFDGVPVSLRKFPEIYSRFLELRGQTKPGDITWPDDQAAGKKVADQIRGKYGDRTLLQVLNDTVDGEHKDDQWAKLYEAAKDPGAQQKIIREIITDYGRLARAKVLDEFPNELGPLIDRGRRERSTLER